MDSLWYNPYIAVPLITWAITQFAKFIIAASTGRLDYRYLYASGGMPSVHAAVTVSLAMTALLVAGPQSAIFGFAAVFAAIVMYDSLGVRRATGEQGVALNVVVRSLEQNRLALVEPIGHLREILGHKPREVGVGAVLGVVLGALLNYDQLDWLWRFLSSPVSPKWAIAIAIIAAVMVVGAIVQRVIAMRYYRGLKVGERSVRWASMIILLGGITLGVFAFFERQNIAGANWTIWPIIVISTTLLARMASFIYFTKPVKEAIAERDAKNQNAKWLEPAKKKKKKARKR